MSPNVADKVEKSGRVRGLDHINASNFVLADLGEGRGDTELVAEDGRKLLA